MSNLDVKVAKSIPWQIRMLKHSLKKQLKLNALLKMIGTLENQKCLLVTCGDNNGSLNYYFRLKGGNWSWADVSAENLEQMRQFLGEEVYHADPEKLPFDSNSFDIVVSIDVLEHLKQDHLFLKEVLRILKSNGQFLVTVPNGDPKLLANRIRHWVGMRPEKYGHTRAGYTLRELDQVTTEVGFQTLDRDGYSRFFTEMIELLINYFYVFKLSKKGKAIKEGHIAPTTAGELQTHGTAYRLYSFFFPVLLGISKLDVFLSKKTNNAVIIKARKQLLQEVVT